MTRNYLLIILNVLVISLYGQNVCILNNYEIADDRLAAIPIIVSGATTSFSNDQICNISIKFTHESINQLTISLVSPAGQRLNILGPGTAPSNPSFPPIEYDVAFVQCAQMPMPDIGYQSRWNNGQVWFGPRIQGSYYPFQGCLEDINTGNINGTWILEIEDVSAFDVGNIECLNIEFCNSKNINTQFCDTKVGRFRIASDSYCENQTYNLAAITTFPNGMSSSASYDNRYAVSNGSQLVDYFTGNIPQGGLAPGTYTVCQYSVFRPDAPSLPQPGSIMQAGDFGSEFARLGLCGAVSNCITMEVKPITDSIVVNPVPICKGSTYTFRGRTFDTAGTYYVAAPNIDPNLCDSIFVINLQVLDLTPTIVADNPSLACNLFSITLNAENPLLSDSAKYTWTTATGNITYTNKDTIRVDKIGTYSLTLTDQGCTASSRYEVLYDPSAPTISVSADTITCDKPNATVTVTSTGVITSTDWLGVGTPQGINQVLIGSTGPVNGFVTHSDGCRVPIPTIDIKIDTITTKPVIAASPSAFDCINRSSSLQITNGNLFRNNLDFYFQNPVGGLEQVLFPDNIVNAGTYRVDAIMQRNGCPVSQTITLRDTSYTPNVTLETFCRGREVWVRGVADRPFGTLVWNGPNGPGGFNNNSLEQRVTTDGIYALSFISRSGCPARDTSIPIVINQQFPNFVVNDDSISCTVNSVQLRPLQTQANASYTWTGPFNFTSNAFTIDATAIGTYIGTATFPNGCQTRDTVNVTLFTTDSDPGFAPDIIVDCSRDTIELIPTDQITYTYTWQTAISPPILSPPNATVALVQQPGIYRVIAKDRSSGCEIKIEVQVGDERDLPKLDSVITKKTCVLNSQASIDVRVDSLTKVQGIEWSGPAGFNSTNLKIDSLQEGTYIYKLTTKKGCNLKDTFQIIHDLELPIITVKAFDTLNCSGNFSKTINAVTDKGEDRITWLAGSVVLSQAKSVTINRQNFNTNNANGVFNLIARRPSNGCESPPFTINLVWDTLPAQIIKTPMDITCLDTTPTISFQSDKLVFSVEWKKNGVVVPGNIASLVVNAAGFYSLTSTDNRRCVVRDTILVNDLRDSVDYNFETEVVGCEGGIISLIDTQGFSAIVWSGPDSIPNDTYFANIQTPGTYSFQVTTPLGCVYKDSVIIAEDKASPMINGKISDTLTCSLIAVNINFTADKEIKDIKWYGNGMDTAVLEGPLNVASPGTYFGIIKAVNNCTTTDSIEVFQNITKPFVSLLTDSLVCSRSFARVRVDSSSVIRNYEWKGPNGFAAVTRDINATEPGIYTLQAFGRNGCDTIVSTEVRDVKRIPNLMLPDSFFIPCNGDSALVNVISDQPIRLFRWTSSTAVLSTSDTLSTTQEGKVFLNVLSTENCQAQDSIFLLKDLRVTDARLAGNDIFCSPDSTFLQADLSTENIGFWWITPDNQRIDSVLTLSSDMPGTYMFFVEKSFSCIDTFDIVINIDNSVPVINTLIQDSPLLCKNTEVELLASISHVSPGRLQYIWSLNDAPFAKADSTISTGLAGNYKLVVIDSVNQCFDTAAIALLQEQSTIVSFDVFPTAPTCFGGDDGQIELQSVLGGFGPFMINLNRPGQVVNDSLISGLESRQYVVTLKDKWGCELSKSLLVPNGLFFTTDLPADTSIRLGEVLSIGYQTSLQEALLGSVSFYYNGEPICKDCSSADFSPVFSGSLVVEVLSETGCVALDTMEIYVAETIDWLFPNIISKGGRNGVFFLPENKGVEVVEQVSIYDRWGNMVYSRNDLIPGDAGNGWDGTFDGRDLLPGVYAVYVRALLKNGRIFQTRRDITLLR